ncbi:hypothetical protein QIW31_05295 [Francisellaceae bacterium CB299]|jgi:hypothetical protein
MKRKLLFLVVCSAALASCIDPNSDKDVLLQNVLKFGLTYNGAPAVGIDSSSIQGFQNALDASPTQVTVTYTPDSALASLIGTGDCQLLDSNTNIMSTTTATADSQDMTSYGTPFNSLLAIFRCGSSILAGTYTTDVNISFTIAGEAYHANTTLSLTK